MKSIDQFNSHSAKIIKKAKKTWIKRCLIRLFRSISDDVPEKNQHRNDWSTIKKFFALNRFSSFQQQTISTSTNRKIHRAANLYRIFTPE